MGSYHLVPFNSTNSLSVRADKGYSSAFIVIHLFRISRVERMCSFVFRTGFGFSIVSTSRIHLA